METLLTTIANAFYTIEQEYERLVGIVSHMSKVQGVNTVVQMPILPFLKQETKMEIKQEQDIERSMEPVPSTSHERPVTPVDTRTAQVPTEVTGEEDDKKMMILKQRLWMNILRSMFCQAKGKIWKKR